MSDLSPTIGPNRFPLAPVDFPTASSAFGWFKLLRRQFPQWYSASPRTAAHPKPWPAGFNPQGDSVFAHNEMFLAGIRPAAVFAVLVQATRWPAFYPNASDVQLPEGDPLRAGTSFHWKTFSTPQASTVSLYEPDQALGWTAESFGVSAFHRWILEPQDNGTQVITEECQHGFGAWLVRHSMNPSLHATHQLWLEQLKFVVTPGSA